MAEDGVEYFAVPSPFGDGGWLVLCRHDETKQSGDTRSMRDKLLDLMRQLDIKDPERFLVSESPPKPNQDKDGGTPTSKRPHPASLENLKKGGKPGLRKDGSYGRMTIAQTERFIKKAASGASIVKQARGSGYPKGSVHHLHHALADRIAAARKKIHQGKDEPETEVRMGLDEPSSLVETADAVGLISMFGPGRRAEQYNTTEPYYPPVKIPTTIWDVVGYFRGRGFSVDLRESGKFQVNGSSERVTSADLVRMANVARLADGVEPFVIEDGAVPLTASDKDAAE